MLYYRIYRKALKSIFFHMKEMGAPYVFIAFSFLIPVLTLGLPLLSFAEAISESWGVYDWRKKKAIEAALGLGPPCVAAVYLLVCSAIDRTK